MTGALALLFLQPALDIWEELVEAYHGVNGFGSTVAEVYAYRLAWRSPYLELPRKDGAEPSSWLDLRPLRSATVSAADALTEICDAFERQHSSASITIDGLRPAAWRKSIGLHFDHLAHVEVTRKSK